VSYRADATRFTAQRDRDTIDQIENAAKGTDMIPASRVKSWLRHAPSVEVLGAITHHIVRQSRRVEPPLSMEEICSIVEEYYKQCLIQDLQESDYAPNRSVAGLELVGWFRSLWRDAAVLSKGRAESEERSRLRASRQGYDEQASGNREGVFQTGDHEVRHLESPYQPRANFIARTRAHNTSAPAEHRAECDGMRCGHRHACPRQTAEDEAGAEACRFRAAGS
jgi:hypothetical protein